MKLKKILVVLFTIFLISSLGACSKSDKESKIRVGSKDFTENLIVAEIYALALEDAGYKVERKMNIAGSIAHTSIMNDEIDLYPEYTGTGLLSILKLDMITDPEEVYKTVKEEYNKQFKLWSCIINACY